MSKKKKTGKDGMVITTTGFILFGSFISRTRWTTRSCCPNYVSFYGAHRLGARRLYGVNCAGHDTSTVLIEIGTHIENYIRCDFIRFPRFDSDLLSTSSTRSPCLFTKIKKVKKPKKIQNNYFFISLEKFNLAELFLQPIIPSYLFASITVQ